ncbi:spore germination protein [Microaerobacter geothermalis]|uniref:GerAB/ArcD/ProY family transporter n=1 Tax=Microaerobacter geothermalis TaxID=674972 RepID=UPI001F2EC89F|nr:endospore germination permease [Microaerobacter geothermalis]MCF6093302.1 spore germination protein [Microaerobacter geothermalis]
MRNAKIDQIQYFSLFPNLVFGKAIGFTSGVLSRQVGADVWTSMLIGFVIGTLIMLFMTFIGSRFPDKTILQYSSHLLGKWPAKWIGVILFLFFSVAFTTSANVITLHIKEYLLPETPMIVLTVSYVLLSMYGVILGIEVILRLALFALIMTILLDFLMVIGSIAKFDIMNLLPLFDRGIVKNITSSIYLFPDLSFAVLAVGMLFPLLNQKKKAYSLTFKSMIAATLLTVTWPLFEIGVMGADITKQYVVTCMQMARSAQLTLYLPRYELIMMILFVWGVIIQSMVMFYCAMYSFKQTTGIKKDWYIILPLSLILMIGTYLLGYDHNRFVDFLTTPWPQITTSLSTGLPVILFLAALIRGKLKRTDAE